MTLDWADLRTLKGSQQLAFEELCCQLAKYVNVPENSSFFRKGTPDAGVECYWILPDDNELGWQAKFFRMPPQKSQWAQITKSIKKCLDNHPKITEYTVCIPLDRADPRLQDKKHFMDKWNEYVEKWEKLAEDKLNKRVNFKYWGESELINMLSQDQHRGRVFFWFNKEIFTQKWFKEKIEETLANVGVRYSQKLNIKFPIAKIFEYLGRTDIMLNEITIMIKKLELLLNEYENSDFKIPTNEELEESIQNAFDTMVTETNISNFSPSDECFRECITKIINILNWVKKDFRESIDLSTLYDNALYCTSLILPYQSRLDTQGLKLSLIKKFTTVFTEIYEFADGKLGKLTNEPYLLIKGDAGVGKTHLFCDIANERLKKKLPTILILGEQFTPEEPWTQIKKILDLNCTTEEFLQALDSYADSIGRRILLLIDGLNEGKGVEIWPYHLSGVLQKLTKYSGIGLGLSVRNEYENLIIPTQISSKLISIEHFGFEGMDESTFHEFLKYYGLEIPCFPILIPEFKIPLFLKILCEGLQKKGLKNIPRGRIGITSIFINFIDNLYTEKLYRPENLDSNRNINYLKKAIIELSKSMAESNSKYIRYDRAYEIVNEILPSGGYNKSLFRYMETESIIQETVIFENDEYVKYIRFAYERFTDFFIVDYLLDNFRNLNGPQECVKNSTNFKNYIQIYCTIDWGIINSFSILLPEKFNIELINMISENSINDDYLLSFLQSLVWRDSCSFSQNAMDIINNLILSNDNLREEFYYVLLQLISIPEHPLNANFLNNYLSNLSLSERDSKWTLFINQESKLSNLLIKIIEWAWFSDQKRLIPLEILKLYGISLPWIFSSSNPYLRDRATKALVSLFSEHISELPYLFNKFNNVNDLYVLERVIAVLYGCCLRTKNQDIIRDMGLKIYEWAFHNKNPTQHLLIRDYCRQVIELALVLDPTLNINTNQIRPPYSSTFNQLEITNQMKLDLEIKRNDEDYRSLAFSIFDWDFARYIIGTNDNFFPWSYRLLNSGIQTTILEELENFNLMDIQYWIFNKVLELGWTPQLFKEHDSKAKKDHYKYRFTERIGKKYQMIAYYMLLSIVSDNFEFINEVEIFPRQSGKYDGPWQISHGRDIDPSCLLNKQEDLTFSTDEKKWWYPFIHNKWDQRMGNNEWMRTFKDLPNMKENIEITNPSYKSRWLVLEGLCEWRESVLIDSPEWNLPHKTIWMKIKSYLVKKEDFNKIYACLKDKNFMGNWMPSLNDPSDVFLGEYYWGIPFIEKYIDWYGRFDWTYFIDNLQIKILPTTDYYVRGSSWRDYSLEGIRLRILLLHRWLKEKMKLDWNIIKNGFYDEEEKLIAFDVSYLYDKPDVFVINKEKCIEFLEKEKLSLFWIVYGNKHIVGDYFEDENIRYDINGFFWLKNNKIEGNIGVIDVRYPSINEFFNEYKSKTGKNAEWHGKITKKFKQWYYKKIEE